MADWNVKVGSENESQQSVTVCCGYGTINERGRKLIDVTGKHNFFIVNTRFEQKATRKWAWLSPDCTKTEVFD